MKIVLLAIVAVSIITSCGDSKLDEKKYEQAKENLEEKERSNPLSFLIVTASDKKNMLGQTVVKGVVENKASVCAYENVRVKMLFYKDGSLVENHEEVLDDVVRANNKSAFKSKYFTPKGTDSVALSIMSADAVDK